MISFQKKIVSFNKAVPFAGLTENNPVPARKSIPIWFKSLLKFAGGEMKTDGNGNKNATAKACPPFLDALMTGYTIRTEFDLWVTKRENGHFFEWSAGKELVGTHGIEQTTPEQVPAGYARQPYKFSNLWQIQTPSGYSTLFTHPLNRYDLPFLTVSGVVETDVYMNTINFPFFIREDFEGMIPAGTPIAQCIPIRREPWAHELGEADYEQMNIEAIKLRHKWVGGYKSQWWQKKNYL